MHAGTPGGLKKNLGKSRLVRPLLLRLLEFLLSSEKHTIEASYSLSAVMSFRRGCQLGLLVFGLLGWVSGSLALLVVLDVKAPTLFVLWAALFVLGAIGVKFVYHWCPECGKLWAIKRSGRDWWRCQYCGHMYKHHDLP